VNTGDPAIREVRRLRERAVALREQLGPTVHALMDARKAAGQAAQAVADTLAHIHRSENGSSAPSPESH
jgi:hypothetical protein